jgi:hypothetical protein
MFDENADGVGSRVTRNGLPALQILKAVVKTIG